VKAPACFNHLRRANGKRTRGRPCGRPMVEIRSAGGQLLGWRCTYCSFVATVEALKERGDRAFRRRQTLGGHVQ